MQISSICVPLDARQPKGTRTVSLIDKNCSFQHDALHNRSAGRPDNPVLSVDRQGPNGPARRHRQQRAQLQPAGLRRADGLRLRDAELSVSQSSGASAGRLSVLRHGRGGEVRGDQGLGLGSHQLPGQLLGIARRKDRPRQGRRRVQHHVRRHEYRDGHVE